MDDLKMTFLFHKPVEEVFDYFTRPELFELWGAPDGMTLKVHHMEAFEGGNYSMTHTGPDGDYQCNGTFKEYIPDKKLVQIDSVLGPDGNAFFHDLECITEFEEKDDNTKITITQRGFTDEKSVQECKKSWDECFAKLEAIFTESNFPEFESSL